MDKIRMKKHNMVYVIGFLLLVFVLRFFSGIYKDDEHSGKYFFIKNTPTWKWYFYSPRSMSDLQLDDMSKEKRKEQIMFDKYVSNRIWEFPIF